jgi:hypothetical protein
MASLAICSAQSRGEDSGSGISGVIQISPFHSGPVREDTPNVGPLANITFIVQNQGSLVTSFTTDFEGRFHVSLAPGHYQISRKGEQPKIGRFGPFEVDVVAGKITKVEWQCDSGRR